MSRGTYIVALAAIKNARPHNARKDKSSGKEQRCREDDRDDSFRTTEEHLAQVTPRLTPGKTEKSRPVTLPMGQKKLAIVRRRLEFAGVK